MESKVPHEQRVSYGFFVRFAFSCLRVVQLLTGMHLAVKTIRLLSPTPPTSLSHACFTHFRHINGFASKVTGMLICNLS